MNSDLARIDELAARMREAALSEAEQAELDGLLLSNPDARRRFVDYLTLEIDLREDAARLLGAAEPVQNVTAARSAATSKWFTMAVLTAVAASVLAAVAFGPQFLGPRTIATLASSENAAWESSLPTMPGSELTPGSLKLISGIATIRFRSGAEVLMEAPANLELISPMRGKLVDGAAMVTVPEPAIGFVLETPDGYVVDHGTQFAVTVAPEGNQTDFEVIEGEISVHLPSNGDEVRLTGRGRTATILKDSLVVYDADEQEDHLPNASNVIRIGTNGRSSSVLRNNRRKFIPDHALSVKHTNTGKWDHRSFFSFDPSAVDLDQVVSVRLRLNLVPSNKGLASRLPVTSRFGVYGLTNPAKKNWKIDGLWEESPAPEDGDLLGTFDIPRSEQRGSFGIENEELLSFLKANRGGPVTLILVRETTQIEGSGPGLTHLFAADSHPEAAGPMLEFTWMEKP